MQINFLSLFILLCGLMLINLGVFAWRRHPAVGAQIFALFTFSQAIYVLGYAMELSSLNLDSILFWSKVEYIGILSFPTLYLLFCLNFSSYGNWIKKRWIILLFVLPTIFMLFKLFDEQLYFIYSSTSVLDAGFARVLKFTPGPFYYVSVTYNLIIVTIGNGMLAWRLPSSTPLYKRQVKLILTAASVLYISFLLYLLNFQLIPSLANVDTSPITYSIWVAAVGYSIFRHGLFDLNPIAREALIETMSDGVIVLDNQERLVDANPAATNIYSWNQVPIGQPAIDVLGLPENVLSFSKNNPNVINRIELRIPPHSDDVYYEVSISNLKDKANNSIGQLVVLHDISERKRSEQKLHELTLVDDLTNIHNRRGFYLLASQLLQLSHRMNMPLIVYYGDLDGMKWINDTLGHVEGDRALSDTAYILKTTYRSSDVIARIGGDEFVALSFVNEESSADAMENRLHTEIDHFNQLKKRTYQLSISIGHAIYHPSNPVSLDQLLEQADKAMYKNKQAKKASPPT